MPKLLIVTNDFPPRAGGIQSFVYALARALPPAQVVPGIGEAFTMLTMPPGPDIQAYHDRQIVILERGAWADWLDPSVPAQEVIRPLAAGSLQVRQVG